MPPPPRRQLALTALLIGGIALCGIAGSSAADVAHPDSAARYQPPAQIDRVRPSVETDPVAHAGDAADDPAIWVHPTSPGQSLVIGNDKLGALDVYDLDGALVQRITSGPRFWGNVDVRQSVNLGGTARDVVAAMNGGLRFFSVDPDTRTLSAATEGGQRVNTGGGEGLCLYRGAHQRLYAFVIARSGRVRQYQVTDADDDGRLKARQVRQFFLGSEGEGCVADDQRRVVYFSQEDVGLWRRNAEPHAPAAATLVDRTGGGGRLVADVEGVTLATVGQRGYLIVSAQYVAHPNRSYFAVYTRWTNAFVTAFRIVTGNRGDGCERTDGIAAYAGSLGPGFEDGVFVCQDNGNTAPARGHQNFKFTPLENIVTLR